jgi:hypothetical protein
MAWHDPTDMLHSSAISRTVKRRLERTTGHKLGQHEWHQLTLRVTPDVGHRQLTSYRP